MQMITVLLANLHSVGGHIKSNSCKNLERRDGSLDSAFKTKSLIKITTVSNNIYQVFLITEIVNKNYLITKIH